MKITTVLLDMGGVLLNMAGAEGFAVGTLDWRGREALLARLNAHGAHLELSDLEERLFEPWRKRYEQRYAEVREAPWEPHLRRLRRGTGVRLRNLTLLEAWFRPYGDQLRPIAGARDALRELRRRGLRLALVSNVPLPGRLYRKVLERHRLAAFLESFQFSYDAGSRKPSPVMLRRALADLGKPPHEALMVGDRRASDVAAGRVAGVGTVWVRSEHSDGPEPDYQVDSVAELPDLLSRLEAGQPPAGDRRGPES